MSPIISILKTLDVPQWLIDNLCDLSTLQFLEWLSQNINRLIEINMEYQDMAYKLRCKSDDSFLSDDLYDDLPFPDVF